MTPDIGTMPDIATSIGGANDVIWGLKNRPNGDGALLYSDLLPGIQTAAATGPDTIWVVITLPTSSAPRCT